MIIKAIRENIFMRTSLVFLVSILLFCSGAMAQEKKWKFGMFNFFDNSEFGRSEVKIPQTMAGVQFVPQFGLRWDSVHNLDIGGNILHELGSPRAIDKLFPTAYYELNNRPVRFLMGAFPRSIAIENYPRMFFQDSVSYYRPNINGIYWEYSRDKSYINFWLDWTGRQSVAIHEAFFVGFSGRYNRGIIFLQNWSYLFHFAAKMNPVVEEALHDNGLFLTSAGVDFAGKTCLRKLEASAGWVVGMERSRADNTGWLSLNGILVETRMEYKLVGLSNSLYKGSDLMYFYQDHGYNLYWGDAAYRAKTYDRLDFYIKFLQNRAVKIDLTYSLHFLESRIYHEQLLKVVIALAPV